MSYTDSHKYPAKGLEYENLYRSSPWEIYSNRREGAILMHVLRQMKPGGGINYLDFACGTGRIARVLEEHVETAVGVDVSESMLQYARQKLKRTKLILQNVLETDVLDKEKFELITSFRFFVNAEPSLRNAAMEYLGRRLSQHGQLIFNVHQNSQSLFVRITKAIQRMRAEPSNNVARENYWSISEAAALLRQHNLKVVKTYAVGILRVPWVPLLPAAFTYADQLASRSRALCQLSSGPVIVAARA